MTSKLFMIQTLVTETVTDDCYITVHEVHIFHTFQIHTNTVPTNISVGIADLNICNDLVCSHKITNVVFLHLFTDISNRE